MDTLASFNTFSCGHITNSSCKASFPGQASHLLYQHYQWLAVNSYLGHLGLLHV